MERVAIHSGLAGFVLIDAIDHVDGARIQGRKRFASAPVWMAIETLAQLGGLHVRFINGFDKHAFLACVRHCSHRTNRGNEPFDECYAVSGTLIGRGSDSYSYRLQAVRDGSIEIDGEFVFATVEYGALFKKDLLESRYRRVFSCLTSDSKTD